MDNSVARPNLRVEGLLLLAFGFGVASIVAIIFALILLSL